VLDELFKRFEQADQSISRRFGGSGLGLFISESLASLMGGEIDASSIQDQGSKFQLTIPYQRSDIPAYQQGDHASNFSSVLSERFSGEVLVAEDTVELQLLERRILEALGATVSVVNNGKLALEAAMGRPFDLILMDMQMPEMDGIEATEALRANGYSGPIVALTANVMQKHRDAFNQAGCDAFLGKPIDKQELKALLKQYLSCQPIQPAVTPEERPAAKQDEMVDDELMAIFVQSANNHREKLIDALSAKNWRQIRETAHTIKGSATSFGYPELSQLGKEICDAMDQGEQESVTDQVLKLLLEIGKVIS
jgi:CheY-like chemotaxis protein